MPSELSPAERAAAEALHLAAIERGDVDADIPVGDFADDARAVVAAVRPEIYDEIAAEVEQSPMFVTQNQRAAVALLFRTVAEGQRRSLRAERQAEGSGSNV